MKKLIKEYIVVEAISVFDLSVDVNALLNKGYQLLGNAQISCALSNEEYIEQYCQTLVMYEEE